MHDGANGDIAIATQQQRGNMHGGANGDITIATQQQRGNRHDGANNDGVGYCNLYGGVNIY